MSQFLEKEKEQALATASATMRKLDNSSALEDHTFVVPDSPATPADPARRQNQESRLLALPGELRNEIYSIILDLPKKYMTPWPSGKLVPPRSYRDPVALLLCICKQIDREVESLMTQNTRAYVPIVGYQIHPYDDDTADLDTFFATTPSERDLKTHAPGCHIEQRPACETAMRALTKWIRVHIHLHTAYLEALLYTAICTFVESSERIWTQTGKRRHAIVHSDIQWPAMFGRAVFEKTIEVMATDPYTDWELRFLREADRPFRYGKQVLNDEVEWLRERCGKHGTWNWKIVFEMYGKMKWDIGDKIEECTRAVSPVDTNWAIPDSDASWRKKIEVESCPKW
ncbi:hypothetical protein BDV96DRAFT_653153 [Lophiotrema nucula]|uniref:Uncharacterized protein n=1 Tax=Lophiotrema nucula TaxID=690887 RepID=A0A6A5YME7_9PLEO|nr:hypothetical protein BDV96DRAFT_653153 [Lophiotrema nucula]